MPSAGRSASTVMGDEDEDHRVVEVFHDPLGIRGPASAVVQRAYAVQARQTGREDRRARLRGSASGQRDQPDPGRNRDDERDLVEPATKSRLRGHTNIHRATIRLPAERPAAGSEPRTQSRDCGPGHVSTASGERVRL